MPNFRARDISRQISVSLRAAGLYAEFQDSQIYIDTVSKREEGRK